MPPVEACTRPHLARARRLAGTARLDLLIGLGLALAGVGEAATAVLFVRTPDLLGWLVRVQLCGFLGMLASVWGWALADQAWHRLTTARDAVRAILAGRQGWAFALAGLEDRPRA